MNLSEWVGAYGALLSTVVAYRQWRSNRPKITFAAMPAYNGAGFEPEGQFVRTVVANPSSAELHFRQAYLLALMDWATWHGRLKGLILRSGRWRSAEQLTMPLPESTICIPALPATLKPGQSLVIWVPQADYNQIRYGPRVRGMQVGVQDETDRVFESPPLAQFGVVALPGNVLPVG